LNKIRLCFFIFIFRLAKNQNDDNEHDDDESESVEERDVERGREIGSTGVSPLVMVFNALSTAIAKSASNAMKRNSQGMKESGDGSEEEEEEEDVYYENVEESTTILGEKS
jgi:glutamate synthase domain-containing protein 2